MNKEAFEKIKSAPTALFTNVTDNPETIKSPENPASGNSPGINPVTLDDISKGNEHTTIPVTPGISTPGNPGAGSAPQSGGSSVSVGNLIGAKWVTDMMDSLLPGLFVASFYAVGMKFKKSEFQLTQDEKNTIAPIMKQCMDTINLNFDNPWHCLMVTVGVIYGSKITEKGLVKYIDNLNEARELKKMQSANTTKATPNKEQSATVVKMSESTNDSKISHNANPEKIPQSKPVENQSNWTREQIDYTRTSWKLSEQKAIARLNKYGFQYKQ